MPSRCQIERIAIPLDTRLSAVVSSLDGTEVQFKNKYGDALENRQRFVDGTLLQESRTSDGGGSTRFSLQPDGKTMLVTRISHSPKLPGTVEFRLTYARQQGTP